MRRGAKEGADVDDDDDEEERFETPPRGPRQIPSCSSTRTELGAHFWAFFSHAFWPRERDTSPIKKVPSRITRRTSLEHAARRLSDSLVAPVGVSRSRAAPRRAAVAARASTDAAATACCGRRLFRTATDRVTLGTSDLSVAATGAGAWAWGDVAATGARLGGRPRQEPRRLQDPPRGRRGLYRHRRGVRLRQVRIIREFMGTQPRTPRSVRRSSPPSSRRSPSASAPRTYPTRSGRPWPAWASEGGALHATLAAFGLPGVTEACNDAFLEGLCLCYEQGLCRAVGVSNFNAERVRRAKKFKERRAVRVNQIQYSLAWNAGDGHWRRGRV